MMKVKAVSNQRGVAAIVVGVSLVMFLGFAALAVDLGYVMVTRNELQNAADAAALGATRQLGVTYEGLSYGQMPTYVCDPALLINVAREIALKNGAAGKAVAINDSDVTIGRWNASTKVLTPTLVGPDAVRVQVRRDSSANGPISTFFAKIWGKDTIDVTAAATAALTAQSTAGPGGLPIPVGISRAWFNNKAVFCNQPIKFYPTNSPEGCAGWHTYDDSPPNASQLRRILDGLRAGNYVAPEATAGASQFEFVGGTIAADFPEMQALFDYCKTLNDGEIDQDTDPTTWTTAVVVYDSSDCTNPNKPTTIVGFSTVTIYQVLTAPEKTILGKVVCDNIDEGRGGGGTYGTLGSIPGLVQ
ncbi:MAG: hypothetical protein A2170_03975 [Deltaproteobacteria bacterium RBG_13_53_10]|nr:MAG: hypothetical protein A2170_03975 [Deltaproteobacteria bacterium RBG_13_53_10]